MLLLAPALFGQNHYNIRLDFIKQTGQDQVCYEVQLSAADGKDLNLAGQNYRIYFDTDILKFDESESSSLLPPLDYTDLILTGEYENLEAPGVGTLSYSDNMTFLNFGMDLKDVANGGIVLPADGSWVKTAELCFEVKSGNASQTGISLHWAREALTDVYATAFVEVAEWKGPNQTIPARAKDFYDLDLVTSLQEYTWSEIPTVYPNPTSGELRISFEAEGPVDIEVWEVSGKRMVDKKQVLGGSAPYQMDLSHLPDGAYMLVLISGKKTFVQTVSKFNR